MLDQTGGVLASFQYYDIERLGPRIIMPGDVFSLPFMHALLGQLESGEGDTFGTSCLSSVDADGFYITVLYLDILWLEWAEQSHCVHWCCCL